jgi:hypothetical protein
VAGSPCLGDSRVEFVAEEGEPWGRKELGGKTAGLEEIGALAHPGHFFQGSCAVGDCACECWFMGRGS